MSVIWALAIAIWCLGAAFVVGALLVAAGAIVLEHRRRAAYLATLSPDSRQRFERFEKRGEMTWREWREFESNADGEAIVRRRRRSF